LVIPIFISEDVVGSLELGTLEPRHFPPEAVGLACSVAQQIAGSLARTWSERERRVLAEQYHQSQKMEALGLLTGGIAHEFNNLLTVMNGFAELLGTQLSPDSHTADLTNKIQRSGRRAANLVRQLLAFSRAQIINPQVLDLNQAVAEMYDMLSAIIGEDIEIETRLAPDLWPIKVDLAQIELAIINLAVNARDAMPGGGRLTVETSNVTLDRDDLVELEGLYPGPHVVLTISDTGVGMSQQVRSRIFEPFFTTKEVGQGSGLGLPTVHGIIRQSDGDIVCTSREGVGTTFTIYLPRTRDAVRPSVDRLPETAVPTGSETLLVVEDDADVRDMVRHTLQGQGYTLLEAGNGQQALEIAASHPGPIHLLLTDIVMPIMNGTSLAGQLAQNRPDIRTLFMSGYPGATIARHGLLGADVNLLQKPLSPKDLARRVRHTLDSIPN
jgi:signal transduction histidine kinase/CheY-like chemotaxis protein